MARKARQRISYVLPLADQKGGHRLGVNGLAVDSQNSILYSGGRDGVICAWDLNLDLTHASIPDFDTKLPAPQPSSVRQQVQAHTHWINDVALVQSNQALVSASSDITVKIWRPGAADRLPPQTLGLHTDYVKVLAAPSQTSDWIASGGLDRKVHLWDLNGAGQKVDIAVGEDEPGSLSSKEKGSVYALAATENMIASGGPESTVRVWDSRTGKRITKLVGHTDNVRDVLISEDGTTILTASSDRTVKVWSTVAGRCMFTLTMHDASVWSLFSADPDLSVFYSSDKNGLIAKTDTRNTIELDEGISVAVAQEHEGVHKVVAAGDCIWTATSRPSINRWRDVNTDGAEIDVPDNYSMHRASVASARVRVPTIPTTSRLRSSSSAKRKIPFKHMLRLSNTSFWPAPTVLDSEKRSSSILERRTSPVEVQEVIETQSVRTMPDYSIEGQNGIIKHVMLNDRKRVLTLDTAGEVVMWDLLKCVPIKSFGKRDLDTVKDEETTTATVANWCTVDTRTGSVAVVLEENTCFDAEMYADELDLDEGVEFREDQRINFGKWVLRYLFSNLIAEEIRRDGAFRRQLLSAPDYKKLHRDNAPRSIPLPSLQTNGWHGNASAALASPATPRAAGPIVIPPTPGFGVMPATPGQNFFSSPTRLVASHNALSATTEEQGGEQQPSRTSSERPTGDYFTARASTNGVTSPGSGLKTPMTPGDSAVDEATTPSADTETAKGKEAGLFGKKFSMRGMSFGSMKKIGRLQSSDKEKPTAVEEKEEGGESDSRSTKTSDSRVIDDNFFGSVQKIRYSYEDSIQQQLQAQQQSQTQQENGLPVSTSQEIDVQSAIAPSLPAETPVLKPPLNTTILIQEERPEAGGVADLFEGTVGTTGVMCDLVEKTAPMWLGEVLLRNQVPVKDVVKISFILEPQAESGLPGIASDGNNRLNANRMLRAKKILGYIAERIEAPSPVKEASAEKEQEAESVLKDGMKPEEYLELWCQGQMVAPKMTLASIRSHLWRGGGDVVLYYKSNGKKALKLVQPAATAAPTGTVLAPANATPA
ncbi:hypothetical protein BDY17DRAFT_140276 [Neohortaea acidophila]|uniref:Uncharacterized protein n=1 Tax=Neohortaea acidophila TaxID=245834 RepID=A0A6A6PSH3_9PEZI|nr:uncharacterized protein BDY17DRAFT_140276 [Neohortaea acidophila]KAF2483049.1 hypothetical protein BDY17DRAFT_140276 [Neohortaea acidophila]